MVQSARMTGRGYLQSLRPKLEMDRSKMNNEKEWGKTWRNRKTKEWQDKASFSANPSLEYNKTGIRGNLFITQTSIIASPSVLTNFYIHLSRNIDASLIKRTVPTSSRLRLFTNNRDKLDLVSIQPGIRDSMLLGVGHGPSCTPVCVSRVRVDGRDFLAE